MSATDELRKLLDERGVEWTAGEDEYDRKTHWESSGLTWEYFNDDNGDAWLGFLGACESDVSPEQAIAATLGDNGAARSNNGVTVEQVRKAIFNSSSYASYDGAKYYADGISMQAIADELNATLGAGTCRWEYPQGVNGWLGYMVCSECGERFDECVTDVARYCPSCGRKVEG